MGTWAAPAAGINWPAIDASLAIRPAPGQRRRAVGTAGKVRINGASQEATLLLGKSNYPSAV